MFWVLSTSSLEINVINHNLFIDILLLFILCYCYLPIIVIIASIYKMLRYKICSIFSIL